MPVLPAAAADGRPEAGVNLLEGRVRLDVRLDPAEPLDRHRGGFGDEGDRLVRVLPEFPERAEDRELLRLAVVDRAEEDQAVVSGAKLLPLDMKGGRDQAEGDGSEVGGVLTSEGDLEIP